MSLINDVTNLVLGVSSILQLVEDTITDGRQLVENTRLEVRKLKQFKFDPKWKTRVINVPSAVDKTHDLVVDLSTQVQDALVSLVSNLRAIGTVGKVDVAVGQIGGTGTGTGVLKIIEDLNKLKNYIAEVRAFFQALESFVDSVRQIRDELENLETIFLPQGKPKITVELKYRKRIG